MDSVNAVKAIEALGLLAAGGLFAWWQFRDLKREKTKTRRKHDSPSPTQDAPKPKDPAP
jgi:hypothetical protein